MLATNRTLISSKNDNTSKIDTHTCVRGESFKEDADKTKNRIVQDNKIQAE